MSMLARRTHLGGRARPTVSNRYLEAVCPMPRPYETLEQFRRLHHDDLADLSDTDLAREGRCARMRADLDHDPVRVQWLEARVSAIAGERTRRFNAAGNDSPRRPTPTPRVGGNHPGSASGVRIVGGRAVAR